MTKKAIAQTGSTLPSVFENFFRPWNEWFDGDGIGRKLSVPAVNISEDEKTYNVTLAAPGLDKKDFNIEVNGNLLTISAEKEEKSEEKDKRYTRHEYNYTSFSRSFTLPEKVEKSKIEARYENGILTLALPKVKSAKEENHKIKVA